MIVGYLRVSTDTQSVESQKMGVVEYATSHKLDIDRWIEESVSGIVPIKERKLGGILPNLHKGDTLIVSELSRLGRSVSLVSNTIEKLMRRGIRLILVKQNMELNGNEEGTSGMMSKMFVYLCSIFAEMERELLKARVTEGIRRKIASGYDWGSQRRGLQYNTRVRSLHPQIEELYRKGMNAYRISKKLKISSGSAYHYLHKIGLMGA